MVQIEDIDSREPLEAWPLEAEWPKENDVVLALRAAMRSSDELVQVFWADESRFGAAAGIFRILLLTTVSLHPNYKLSLDDQYNALHAGTGQFDTTYLAMAARADLSAAIYNMSVDAAEAIQDLMEVMRLAVRDVGALLSGDAAHGQDVALAFASAWREVRSGCLALASGQSLLNNKLWKIADGQPDVAKATIYSPGIRPERWRSWRERHRVQDREGRGQLT